MAASYDAIFIGGGIMGCCCALELARRGRRVAVVEKGTIGEGPTGQTSGILRTHYSNELTARMAQFGLEFFADFEQRVGDDCGFHRSGFLMIAPESEREALAASVALQQGMGIETEILSGAEILDRMPELDLGDEVDGLVGAWEPNSGYADGYLAVTGMARAAKGLGVDVLQDTEVTGIRFEEGRVQGVDTSAGPLEAPIVVNTAGSWGAHVAALAGVDLPIDPCRVQVAFFRRPDADAPGHPVVADFVHATYFRSEVGGLVAAGVIDPAEADAKVDPDAFPRKVDLRFQAETGDLVSRRCPALADAASEGGYASLYAITPDWHPIVGEVPEGSGFHVCAGFSGHGFKLAPAVGVMVADLLTGAAEPQFDPSLFRPERWHDDQSVSGGYKYRIVG